MVQTDRSHPCSFALLGATLVAAAAVVPASPALAADPSAIEGAFDNTIISTYADGRQARLWIDRGGGYRGEGRRGDASSGHWFLKGPKLCLKQAHPLPVPLAFCTPVVEGGVGTMWSARSVFGEPLIVELAQGR